MILLRQGRTEQGDEPIAEQLADRAAIGLDRLGQLVQRLAEVVAGFFGVGMLQQCGRVADIGEKHADVLILGQHL
ncbi:hypothetical protein ABIF35_005313 [Bradyrhizobium japonicum]